VEGAEEEVFVYF